MAGETGDDGIGSFVRRLVPSASPAEREDMVQDSWLRVLSHADRAPRDPAGRLRWHHAIARNLVRDRWRRAQREAPLMQATPVQAADADLVATLEGDAVRAAFAKLPVLWQRVLVLRVIEERPAGEVGAILGRTAAGIRQIQYRALSRLRHEMTAGSVIDELGGKA